MPPWARRWPGARGSWGWVFCGFLSGRGFWAGCAWVVVGVLAGLGVWAWGRWRGVGPGVGGWVGHLCGLLGVLGRVAVSGAVLLSCLLAGWCRCAGAVCLALCAGCLALLCCSVLCCGCLVGLCVVRLCCCSGLSVSPALFAAGEAPLAVRRYWLCCLLLRGVEVLIALRWSAKVRPSGPSP